MNKLYARLVQRMREEDAARVEEARLREEKMAEEERGALLGVVEKICRALDRPVPAAWHCELSGWREGGWTAGVGGQIEFRATFRGVGKLTQGWVAVVDGQIEFRKPAGGKIIARLLPSVCNAGCQGEVSNVEDLLTLMRQHLGFPSHASCADEASCCGLVEKEEKKHGRAIH